MLIHQLLNYPPYRMVLFSIISLLTYLLIIVFYTQIYPKKKIPYPILLLGLSILPIISVFRQGTYESGDLTIHVSRLMSFYTNLEEGVLIPRWAGELNATYGYAVFIFYYPLAYYIPSLYHFLGFSFLNSVKILLISTYIASGFVIFYWLKNHVSKKYAFLGALFYLYAPYHLVDMHFRATIGEMTAFLFLPTSFLLVDWLIIKRSFIYVFLASVSISLLILSHPAIAVLGFPILAAYAFYRIFPDNLSKSIPILTSFILGLIYSSFYWLPAIIDGLSSHQRNSEWNLVFPKLSELLFSKWRLGFLFQGHYGELAYLLGYSHWIVLLAAIYLMLFKKYRNKIFIFFTILSLTLLFLIQSPSEIIWENISLLKNMLLPYRLLAIIALSTSTIACFVTKKLNSKYFYIFLIVLAVGSTILNWGNRGNVAEINDQEIRHNLPFITYQSEGAWNAVSTSRPFDDLWQKEIPKSHIETITGNIDLISESRTVTKHKYKVVVYDKSLIRENTYYFPGWELYVNNQRQDIIYDSKEYPGIITFYLDPGFHSIQLMFQDTKIRTFSFYLSFGSLLLSGVFLIYFSKGD